MRQGLVLAASGLVAGLALALAMSRIVVSLLFEVEPTDTITLAGVVATIGMVAAAASWLPAYRASRINALDAIRHE
jgi:ABC-type antimicrobial peptide transport system permease subunit